MPSRREFLTACGFGVGGFGAGAMLDRRPRGDDELTGDDDSSTTDDDRIANEAPGPVAPDGATQPGIARPTTPQPFVLLAVIDLTAAVGERDGVGPSEGLAWLADLGVRILHVHDDAASRARDEGACGDLTVTVGIGPALVRRLAPDLPVGTDDLPRFDGDAGIDARHLGGDVCLQLCATEPSELRPALDRLLASTTGGVRPTLRWIQPGLRGPGEDGASRNPIGFLDGLAVPSGDEQLSEHIWIPAEEHGPRAAGATIMVVRRLRVDVARFRGLPLQRQETIIGRRRSDGAPLSAVYAHLRRDSARVEASSGDPGTVSPDALVDLDAKSPDGEYLIAPDAHIRAAHPSATDSRLMLRRSYSYDNGVVGTPPTADTDTGLLFVSFQRDLRTFVATQHRLDERDALAEFVAPTASGTFLVVPGFDRSRHLGATLVRQHDRSSS